MQSKLRFWGYTKKWRISNLNFFTSGSIHTALHWVENNTPCVQYSYIYLLSDISSSKKSSISSRLVLPVSAFHIYKTLSRNCVRVSWYPAWIVLSNHLRAFNSIILGFNKHNASKKSCFTTYDHQTTICARCVHSHFLFSKNPFKPVINIIIRFSVFIS